MSERLPWFRCVPSALLGALAGMRPDEGYVYVVLLMRIYETGGPVAETDRTLSRRTGMTERKVAAAIQFLIDIAKVYRLPDGRLDSASTHAEIQWQEERRRDQSKAGKASRNKTNTSSAKTDDKSEGKKAQQNQQKASTPVEQTPNHIDKEKEIRSVSSPKGSDTGAEPVGSAPIDPKQIIIDQLWLDGVPALVGTGIREPLARSMIGRWLKTSGGDAARVHWAIEEAFRARSGDPVAYVSRVLSEKSPSSPAPARPATFGQRSREAAGRTMGMNNGQSHDDKHDGPTLDFGRGGEGADQFDLQPARGHGWS